jgi:hypothetical protein
MAASVPQPPPLPPLAPAASPSVVRVPRTVVPVVGMLIVAGFFAGIAAGRFASPSRPRGGDDVVATPNVAPQPVPPVQPIAIAPNPRPVVPPAPVIASAPMPRTVAVVPSASVEVAVAPEPRAAEVAEPKLVAIAAPVTEKKADQCKTYDTKVRFFPNIAAAKDAAKADKKLVFVLHISGDFGDPGFT